VATEWNIHRIWPYILWIPCQLHHIYAIYMWLWPTLLKCHASYLSHHILVHASVTVSTCSSELDCIFSSQHILLHACYCVEPLLWTCLHFFVAAHSHPCLLLCQPAHLNLPAFLQRPPRPFHGSSGRTGLPRCLAPAVMFVCVCVYVCVHLSVPMSLNRYCNTCLYFYGWALDLEADSRQCRYQPRTCVQFSPNLAT